MTETYASTKALSVYNVLSMSKRDLSREAVDEFLRRTFDQNLAASYVADGVAYLVANGFAKEEVDLIVIPRMPNGRGRPVVRSADDLELLGAAH